MPLRLNGRSVFSESLRGTESYDSFLVGISEIQRTLWLFGGSYRDALSIYHRRLEAGVPEERLNSTDIIIGLQ